jgi:ADP-ribose pyrophosphatase YjhB (NUDIX family)
MIDRIRRTHDGTYPEVEEELAKIEERATARAIPAASCTDDDLPDAALAFVVREVLGRRQFLCVWNRHDGCWGLPGGKTERLPDGRREPLLATVLRELKEETDLDGVEPFLLYEANPVDANRVRRLFVFAVTVAKDATPKEMEPGAPVAWLTLEEFVARTKFHVFYRKFFSRLGEINPRWFEEYFGSASRIEDVLRADLAALAPSPGSHASRRYALAPGGEPSPLYLVESIADGWFCPNPACGVWCGDAKVFLTLCRCCGAARPRKGEP